MQRFFMVATLVLSCLASTAPASADPAFDFKETILDNGLRVVTMEDFSCPIVTVQVWYNVGSKDENPNRQGFAHMFEHMMFRGTSNLPPEGYFQLINSVGGDLNGTTDFDRTNYYQTVPANQLDLALWLEAERMLFLNINEEGFETERNVVKEERRLGLNAPYGTLFERVLPAIFTKHPYLWTPIGRIAHLEAAKIDELHHFWDTYYVPSNANLIIVGAVSHQQALEAAKSHFGWMPKYPKPEPVAIVEPDQTGERSVTLQERLGPVPMAVYAFRGVASKHPDEVPLSLLISVLAMGESSRLNVDLVKTRKLCVETVVFDVFLQQDGVFAIGGALNPFSKRETAPVFAALDEHIARVQAEGITPEELQKAKNQRLRSIVFNQLTIADKAREIGDTIVNHGSPDWLNQEQAAIEAVTNDDIQRVAKKYLTQERRTIVSVVPNKEFEYNPDEGWDPKDYAPPTREYQKTGVERPAGWPSEPPVKGLLEELPLAPFEEKTLQNGLKVVVVPNKEVPFISVMLGLDYGGWSQDPDSPAGVANFAARMLPKGTEHYTSTELAEKLESNALSIEGGADNDATTFAISGLADKLPLALELTAEILLRPTFPEDEYKTLHGQMKSNLASQERDPHYQVAQEFRKYYFGNHPYARPADGQLATFDAVTLDRVKAWWSSHGRPDAGVMYIAGDVDPAAAFAEVEKHFASWKAEGKKPEVKLPAIPEIESTRIVLVDTPGAVQSNIYAGQQGINRDHPKFIQARVFAEVFGGSFGSRLNNVLRVQRGLTYGASGTFMPYRFCGVFMASTFTKTETTKETVEGLLEVIKSMQSEPATEAELKQAKSYLVGAFPSALETPGDNVREMWKIQINGLPKDYLQRVVEGYKATTPEQVQDIATTLVHPDKMLIVVLGDAAKVKEGLETIAPVTVVSSDEAPAEPA
ncbi:MAG: hypothetical protein AMXMBFR84_09620 [Candidatus Hydrogenedentota bacterium]